MVVSNNLSSNGLNVLEKPIMTVLDSIYYFNKKYINNISPT